MRQIPELDDSSGLIVSDGLFDGIRGMDSMLVAATAHSSGAVIGSFSSLTIGLDARFIPLLDE